MSPKQEPKCKRCEGPLGEHRYRAGHGICQFCAIPETKARIKKEEAQFREELAALGPPCKLFVSTYGGGGWITVYPGNPNYEKAQPQ